MSSHREQLRELYKQYNPAKLQDVDDLLAKYSGCVARNAEAHSLNTSLNHTTALHACVCCVCFAPFGLMQA